MLTILGLAATGAVTLVLTNLDNLAVLITLGLTSGRRPALLGFLLAQILVLGAALALAEGVEASVAGWAGYLGIVPLALGLWALRRQWLGQEAHAEPRLAKTTVFAALVVFLSLSTDSFAALAPLFADTQPRLRLVVFLGAALAAAALGIAGMFLSRGAVKEGGWLSRIERLGPYAMIAVGLYVLANTGTDAV